MVVREALDLKVVVRFHVSLNCGVLGRRGKYCGATGVRQKWLTAPDCKSGAYGFPGSNPGTPIELLAEWRGTGLQIPKDWSDSSEILILRSGGVLRGAGKKMQKKQ